MRECSYTCRPEDNVPARSCGRVWLECVNRSLRVGLESNEYVLRKRPRRVVIVGSIEGMGREGGKGLLFAYAARLTPISIVLDKVKESDMNANCATRTCNSREEGPKAPAMTRPPRGESMHIVILLL